MAQIPRCLRQQLKFYEKQGFTVKEVSPTAKHWKVRFNEFPQFQIMSPNGSDSHGIWNNVSRYRRLAMQKINS